MPSMPPLAALLGRDGERLRACSPRRTVSSIVLPALRDDRLDELRRASTIALAVDGEDDVAGLEARLLGAVARDAPMDDRGWMSGSTPMSPISIAALGGGPHVHRLTFWPSRSTRHADVAVRPRADRDLEILPGVDLVAGDREDAVARAEAGLLAGEPGTHRADDGRLVEVGGDLARPAPARTPVTTTASTMFITGPMIRIWNRCHLVFDRNSSGWPDRGSSGILAGHLHVAAERNRADAVLGVAARDLQDLRPEAERKREHPDAEPPRREEVPELVHEDQHAEDEEKGKKGRQNQDPQTVNSNSPRHLAGVLRAQPSTRRTTSRLRRASAACAFIVRSMTARNRREAELVRREKRPPPPRWPH